MSYSNNQDHDEFFDPIEPRSPQTPQPYSPYTPPQRDKKKNTARNVIAVIIALVLLGVGFLTGWLVRYYTIDEEHRTFLWALKTTEKYYYKEIDKEKLYGSADKSQGGAGLIKALNNAVDPYSGFYTTEEFNKLIAEGEGQNVGIGIAVDNEKLDGENIPKVLLVVENSPAQEAGIQKGMYIYSFGSAENSMQSGDKQALYDFLSKQGVKNSFLLKVGFHEESAKPFTLKAREYQAAYCYYRDSKTSYSYRGDGSELSLTETSSPIEGLDDSTAYIRLDEFSGKADDEFEGCLETMKERGRSNLILDLRSNGGGYLTIFQSIASHLLKDAEDGSFPIVATANYKSGRISRYRTGSASDYYNYFGADSKVYLLADENTASASECLIGALMDYGTISYGDIYLTADKNGYGKSYGKGIMQSFYQSTLGVMKLTVATINWPVTGNCIHDKGVTTKDGAHGIPSELVWGEEDVLLNTVVANVCNASGTGTAV